MTETSIRRADMFSIATWQTRLPEFEAHLDQAVADLTARWDGGEFKEHQHGYGHNSTTSQFGEENLARYPYLAKLRDGFIQSCDQILQGRQPHAARLRYTVTEVRAWFRIQTPQEPAFPWHHHAPALLSGCYFLKIPNTPGEGEGKLVFQNPDQSDMFMPRMGAVDPQAGDLVIFPSQLLHMPTPSPSADGLRLGINMDLFVAWSG